MSATWRPFLGPESEFNPSAPWPMAPKMATVQCRRAAATVVTDLKPHEAHVHTTYPAEGQGANLFEEIQGYRFVWCLGWPVAE